MDNTLSDCYNEFCGMARSATEKGQGLQVRRYGQNLRYNSTGVYSKGLQIAVLDLENKTFPKTDYLSPISNKHHNHAKYMLELCYDFSERDPSLHKIAQSATAVTKNARLYNTHTEPQL